MWPQIVERVKRPAYNRLCRAIYTTPPVRTARDGVILFSMVGTRALIPYLVAAKSLHHHLRRGRFVVLDDGTLTGQDRARLRHHLDDPEILSIHDVDVGPCPHGGTWERLLTILDRAADDYVIQFDSDTVTTGPLPLVEQAIADNVCFTLLGAESPLDSILDVETFTRRHFPGGAPGGEALNGHIQGATEAVLTRLDLPGLPHPHYVRGCSGFAGFARGQDRRLATAFSQAVSAQLGPQRWREWGSEQVTSNFVVANAPGARVLPETACANYWGKPLADSVHFFHFIGTYRWHGWDYFRRSRAAIRTLRSGA